MVVVQVQVVQVQMVQVVLVVQVLQVVHEVQEVQVQMILIKWFRYTNIFKTQQSTWKLSRSTR